MTFIWVFIRSLSMQLQWGVLALNNLVVYNLLVAATVSFKAMQLIKVVGCIQIKQAQILMGLYEVMGPRTCTFLQATTQTRIKIEWIFLKNYLCPLILLGIARDALSPYWQLHQEVNVLVKPLHDLIDWWDMMSACSGALGYWWIYPFYISWKTSLPTSQLLV